jgi:hypothetical protein
VNLTDAIVVWTPRHEGVANPGAIRLERRGAPFTRTAGDRWLPAAKAGTFKDTSTERLLSLFVLFNTLVMRDGIDAADAHRAFPRHQRVRRDHTGGLRALKLEIRGEYLFMYMNVCSCLGTFS